MKHIMYKTDRSLKDLIRDAHGRYGFKIFVLLFVISLVTFPVLPLDLILSDYDLLDNLVYSLSISGIGGYISMIINKKRSILMLQELSKELAKEQIYVDEKSIEQAVVSSFTIGDEQTLGIREVVDCFYVLDRSNQLKVLEYIKTHFFVGKDNIQNVSLYVLEEDEMNDVELSQEDVQRLKLDRRN